MNICQLDLNGDSFSRSSDLENQVEILPFWRRNLVFNKTREKALSLKQKLSSAVFLCHKVFYQVGDVGSFEVNQSFQGMHLIRGVSNSLKSRGIT